MLYSNKYTPEMVKYLIDHGDEPSCIKLTEDFNRKFGTNFTKKAICHKRNRVRHTSPKFTQHRFIYKKKHDDFLKKHGEGTSNEDLTHMFNDYFGTSVTASSVEHRKYRIGVINGINTKWKPNNHYNQKGEFGEIGSIVRKQEVGSITLRNGYKYIKVSDTYVGGRIQQKNWMPLHKYIWIKHHGNIPKGMMITFKDGNSNNCDISNLMMISRGELAMINRYGEYGRGEIGLNIAKLRNAIRNEENKI